MCVCRYVFVCLSVCLSLRLSVCTACIPVEDSERNPTLYYNFIPSKGGASHHHYPKPPTCMAARDPEQSTNHKTAHTAAHLNAQPYSGGDGAALALVSPFPHLLDSGSSPEALRRQPGVKHVLRTNEASSQLALCGQPPYFSPSPQPPPPRQG